MTLSCHCASQGPRWAHGKDGALSFPASQEWSTSPSGLRAGSTPEEKPAQCRACSNAGKRWSRETGVAPRAMLPTWPSSASRDRGLLLLRGLRLDLRRTLCITGPLLRPQGEGASLTPGGLCGGGGEQGLCTPARGAGSFADAQKERRCRHALGEHSNQC